MPKDGSGEATNKNAILPENRFDVDLAWRPTKRRKTTQDDANKRELEERLRQDAVSRRNGLKILKSAKDKQSFPKYIPGLSATPKRPPKTNLPRDAVPEPPLLRFSNLRKKNDSPSAPLSPHLHSKTYFTDPYAIMQCNSFRRLLYHKELLKNINLEEPNF